MTMAKEQGVAVWMKQLGGIRPGGNIEDFPEDLRLREFPTIHYKEVKMTKLNMHIMSGRSIIAPPGEEVE